MSRGKLNILAAIAASVGFGPMFSRNSNDPREFGRWGEFMAELTALGWILKVSRARDYETIGGPWQKRARAFEAAADVARARGDSAEDCGKLIAGVRW